MIIGSKIRNAKKVELSENAYPVLFAHVGVGDYKDIDLAIEVERNKIKGAIEDLKIALTKNGDAENNKKVAAIIQDIKVLISDRTINL